MATGPWVGDERIFARCELIILEMTSINTEYVFLHRTVYCIFHARGVFYSGESSVVLLRRERFGRGGRARRLGAEDAKRVRPGGRDTAPLGAIPAMGASPD